jgi:hypothetical protein
VALEVVALLCTGLFAGAAIYITLVEQSGGFTPAVLFGAIAAVVLAATITPAFAHPGRLGADGCHSATKKYVYPSSGVVLKAGTRHWARRATPAVARRASPR